MAMTQEDAETRDDPLNRVFPKIAKCTFHKYGPGGTIEKFDGLCILSLNIINEKIYVLLWFWFVFLITVTAIQLIWRILSILSRGTREFILRNNTNNLATVRRNLLKSKSILNIFSKMMLQLVVPRCPLETGSCWFRLETTLIPTSQPTSFIRLLWDSESFILTRKVKH